jgi:hypothetical protein
MVIHRALDQAPELVGGESGRGLHLFAAALAPVGMAPHGLRRWLVL